jgi:hypothetical protein
MHLYAGTTVSSSGLKMDNVYFSKTTSPYSVSTQTTILYILTPLLLTECKETNSLERIYSKHATNLLSQQFRLSIRNHLSQKVQKCMILQNLHFNARKSCLFNQSTCKEKNMHQRDETHCDFTITKSIITSEFSFPVHYFRNFKK